MKVNRRLFDYDQIIIVGPVFPHEVVGFSGGNKYLFPGVAGPGDLEFFPLARRGDHQSDDHRQQMDAGAQGGGSRRRRWSAWTSSASAWWWTAQNWPALFAGSPEAAWDEASELSRRLHITYKDQPFHTILSCAPAMYDELWTGGKCMYKLEPVLADGGELIIYAPHISEISVTHGKLIEQIGYHCRDYFFKQWDRFKDLPVGRARPLHARARHRHLSRMAWKNAAPA